MNPQPSLKKSLVFNALFTALNILYPIVSFAYVSRVLGPLFLGKINFISSIAIYFGFVASLAYPLYATRAIAQVRDNRKNLDKVFSELFLLKACWTPLVCALYASLYIFFPQLRADPLLFAIAGFGILWNVASVEWLFTGLEKYGTIFGRDIVVKIASLVLFILLIRSPEDYHLYLIIGMAMGVGGGIWALAQARPLTRFTLRDLTPTDHLPSILVLLAGTLTAGAYAYLDNVMVGIMTDDKSVGLYSTAIKINRMVILFLVSLAGTIIPRLSFFSANSLDAEFQRMASKSIRFVFMISLPVSAVFLALAPQLLNLLSGPEFLAASTAMRVSVPLILLSGFANYLGMQILFPQGGEKYLLAGNAVAVVTLFVLNLILIPRFGIEGAAAVSAIAQLMACFVYLAGIRKLSLKTGFFDRNIVFYTGISAILGAVAWSLTLRVSLTSWQTVLILSAGGGAYLGCLFLIKDELVLQIYRSFRARFSA